MTTNNQLVHTAHDPIEKPKEIVLFCDHVKGPANIGSLFRLADAFAITEIVFFGTTIDLSSSRLKKTARTTQQHIPYREGTNLSQEIQNYHKDQFVSIALEITSSSIPIRSLQTNAMNKIVLIIGDENYGITDALLSQVHHTVHIPMLGKNSSMNVAQATAIAFYELQQ